MPLPTTVKLEFKSYSDLISLNQTKKFLLITILLSISKYLIKISIPIADKYLSDMTLFTIMLP